jgi:hypothetical protein
LGDALLYSRKFAEAKQTFESVVGHGERDLSGEAFLKRWLAEWLERRQQQCTPVPPFLLTNEWIALANDSVEHDRQDEALGIHLVLAFLFEHDVTLWARTILLSARVGELNILAATILCAHMRCGFEAYRLFHERLAELGAPAEALREIDAISMDLYKERGPARLSAVTVRSLGEHNFDIAALREEYSKPLSIFEVLDRQGKAGP